MQLGNYDLIVMAETNIMDAAYCQNRLRSDVVCSQAVGTTVGRAQGDLGLVVR